MVKLVDLELPHLALSEYSYMDVSVAGSGNVLVRIWFYLMDGPYIIFCYRENVDIAVAKLFDLSSCDGRKLRCWFR